MRALSTTGRGAIGRRGRGFTLIEVMITVAIIAILAALTLPALARARRRSQATVIISELRLIDGAIDQYALEYSKKQSAAVPVAAWKLYMKPGTRLYQTGKDVFGQDFGPQTVGYLPMVPSVSWDELNGTVDGSFWAPYQRSN